MCPEFLPEICLWTAQESLPLWTKAQAWISSGDIPIPFWAFPWVGGQAVARYILDHPDIVRGKGVLDFGSGSGVVAIACRLAGAASVMACDIDPLARVAIAMNAQENSVGVDIYSADPMAAFPDGVDVVTAGDMFYEREPALAFMRWFQSLRPRVEIVAGDPGRHYVPRAELEILAEYDVPASLELEDADVRRTQIYRVI